MRITRLCSTALVAIAAIACGSSSSSNPSNDAGPSGQAPYIYSTVYTMEGGTVPPFGFLEEVFVCTDGYACNAPVTNATVTVNGGALSYDSGNKAYYGTSLIAEGASVTLQVTIGTTVYSASGTQFTTAPTVTAPDAGATWQASSANNITWTGGAPTAGAGYFAQISSLDPSGFHQRFPADGGTPEVPITTTSVIVPAGTLPAPATNFYLLVGIGTPGFFFEDSGGIAIPEAGTGSGLWFGLLAQPLTINTQ